jgi:Carboxypeptidase regulatory-like domain
MAQTVAGTLLGTVLDPASAVVPGATVTLTETETGNSRVATSDTSGVFRFPNIAPGNYSVSIQASGFKNLVQTSIMVGASEVRDLGKLSMAIGNTSEKISVVAEATAIQLASSEKGNLVDSKQLEDVTLKGRDLFGYMKLVPGVIDRAGLLGDPGAGNRDVASENGIRAITINGNSSALNFTVDGITDMDTGSNGTLHYEPNMDAIQELKILTSNYQAEFGRNSGGTITAITKAGTQSFHGSFMWNHRNEGLDANLWQNNRNGRNAANVPNSPISPYRYNVETYAIGGPIFIPHHFNTAKKKLFFFWSQEYTGQFVSGGVQNKYTPTALERAGNFSQSFQNNGSLITITDPTTGAPFPGNTIPTNRITPLGQAMLNFFPLPNFAGTGSQLNVVNYTEAASATHPHRNDVLRVDTYLTSKITGYVRYINDHDDMLALYQGVQFTSDKGGLLGATGAAPIDHPNPGHGYSGTVTYSISPTMINEYTMGKSWNTWSYYPTDNYKSEDRSLLGTAIPALFPLPTGAPQGASATNGYVNILPQFQFGTPPSNSMSYTRSGTSAGNYENFNPIWTFTDNLSKVIDRHTFKVGVYLEHNTKIQPSTPAYAGSFNFTPDSLNSLNTGDGFANALLGYVDSYQQSTGRAVFSTQYWNAEFYIQDNFRVNRRLTLDYGIRFYHQTPQVDKNYSFSNFVPSMYTKAAAPRLYIPGTSGGKRVAIDPGTGAVAPVAYIGLYVPNSGNPADGFQLLDSKAPSLDPYTTSPLAAAPRVGFAYDVMGDGKTALRGGFGIFYNRLDGNQVYNLSGQPPVVFTPQVNYTTFDQISAGGGNLVFGPGTFYMWPSGNIPWDRTQNASLNVQRQLPGGMVLDVGYTGDWQYNQQLSYNINPIPLGTRAPFNSKNADATNSNKTLPDVLLRTQYPGYNAINSYAHLGHTNYNAMTMQLQRRFSRGLAFGVAYTWGHALGTTAYNPVVPNNEAWNYGRQPFDIRNNIQANYTYEIPGLGKHLNSKVLGAVTDHWTLSGVFTIQSGIPFNPGGPNVLGTAPDYTGTPDVGARVNVIGDPFANVPVGHYYNPAAFAPPAYGSTVTTPVLGNLQGGSGVMSLPWIWNADVTMAKFIPVFGERRGFRLQAQAYNVFNHPEYNNVNTGIQWDANGNVSNLGTSGVFSSTLPARVMAFSARFEF